MKKIVFPILIVLALLLSACGNAKTTATATTVPTVPATPASATAAPGSPTPTPAPYTDSQTPCKPFSILDQILPTSLVKIPEVTSADWINGPTNAPVTFTVYTDLQCPYCAEADPIFNAVLKAFPNDVRLVFRHWPLASIHANALQAARAADAAGKQGQDKFFAMTEILFTNQSVWSAKSAADFTTWLNGKAASLGLDAAKFAVDLNDPTITQEVIADQVASDILGNELSQEYQTGFGTPTLIINGSPYMEQRSVELLSLVVNLIKNKNNAVQQCPATIIDTKKDYSATITTTRGDIVIDLLEKSAPVSVNSFVSLAQSGWFKDNIFFVVRDQYVMTGDKTNTGLGGSGYAFKDEIDPAYTFDKEGVVGMYNYGPGTNSSQFFILKTPLATLNGRYTIFGIVTQGMEVLKAMALHETAQAVESADKILSVIITEK
jgi:cyclophilin family peptidyl-prolyl cis-trans isomerase/protein-disulfide isomerase